MRNYWFFVILLCFVASKVVAQPINITGDWIGHATQEMRGNAPFSKYYMALHITKNGDEYQGTAEVALDQDRSQYGVMWFQAVWKDNKLIVKERDLKEEQRASSYSWCLKDYQLSLTKINEKWILSGNWTGAIGESICDPGTLSVTQKIKEKPKNLSDVLNKNSEIIPIHKPITINNLQFEPNSSVILPSSFPSLDSLASYLKKFSTIKARIIGHTDRGGSDIHNQQLSEGRAIAVKNYLTQKGVSDDRLSVIGFGNKKPIADNNTEEGRKINRRVEIEILHQ